MESPKDQVAARLRMRLQQFQERNNDSCKRYNRNLPIKQEKERQENQMFQQRISRAQASKSSKVNKYDLANKQLGNSINDVATNPANVNGSFNEQAMMMQAQKRSFADSFNGALGRDDGMVMSAKAARLPDGAAFHPDDTGQFPNMCVSNAPSMGQPMKSSMTPNMHLDHMNSSIQPNVNPFLHGNGPPESAQLPRSLAMNKTVGNNLSMTANLTSVTVMNKSSNVNANMSNATGLGMQSNSNAAIGGHTQQSSIPVGEGAQDIKNVDDVLSKDGLKKIEKLPNAALLKTEPPVSSLCEPIGNTPTTTAKSEPAINGYPSYEDDVLPLDLAGDLQTIDQFTLFGEVAGTSQNKKERSDKPGSCDNKASERPVKIDNQNLQPDAVKVEHSQSLPSPAQQSSISRQASQQQMQNSSHQGQTVPPISKTTVPVQQQPQQLQKPTQLPPQQKQQLPNTSKNVLAMSSAAVSQSPQQPIATMALSQQGVNLSFSQPSSNMPLSYANSSPLSKMNQMASMQSMTGNSPLDSRLDSRLRSLQSPVRSGNSPKSTMQLQSPMKVVSPALSMTSPQNMPGGIPPVLPPTRKPNLRQQLAEHVNRQQQQQQTPMMPNMSNIPTMPGGYMGGPPGQLSAAEKLQQHLQERMRRQQQQQRYQMMQMQQQQHHQMEMSQKQFMQQQQRQAASMSPMQNPMAQGQNPFQFPNDFASYNQQKQIQSYNQMVMQSPQSAPPPGFYPPPYQVDPSSGPQMFPTNAPPEYRPPAMSRSAMLQRIMRERAMANQQMSDMFSQNMMMSGPSMPNMNQNPMMYGHTAKAPPQYPNQGMQNMTSAPTMDQQQQQQQQQQQMMMQNAAAAGQNMTNNSRLSHFSQPDMAMGMNPQPMNPMQGRVRSNLDQYGNPPSLSRSMSVPNEVMISGENMGQLSNFGNNVPHPAMMRNNPSYNHNWGGEHQMMMQYSDNNTNSNDTNPNMFSEPRQQQQQQTSHDISQRLPPPQQSQVPQQQKSISLTLSDTSNAPSNPSKSRSASLPQAPSSNNTLPPSTDTALSTNSSSIPADEEADIDSLLNNPPPTFDLVNLLS